MFGIFRVLLAMAVVMNHTIPETCVSLPWPSFCFCWFPATLLMAGVCG